MGPALLAYWVDESDSRSRGVQRITALNPQTASGPGKRHGQAVKA